MLLPAGVWRAAGEWSAHALLLLPPAALSGAAFPLAVRMVVDDPRARRRRRRPDDGGQHARRDRRLAAGRLRHAAAARSAGEPAAHHGHRRRGGLRGVVVSRPRRPSGAAPRRDRSPRVLALARRAAPPAARACRRICSPRRYELVDSSRGIRGEPRGDPPSAARCSSRPTAGGRDRTARRTRCWRRTCRCCSTSSRGACWSSASAPGRRRRAFCAHDVERLDCVDIEPAVFDLVRPALRRRLDGRSRASACCATTAAATSRTRRRRYDVISLEVGQLFRPGVANFYTRRLLPPGARAAGAERHPVAVRAAVVPHARRRSAAWSPPSSPSFPQSVLWYNTAELLLVGVNADRFALPVERLAPAHVERRR